MTGNHGRGPSHTPDRDRYDTPGEDPHHEYEYMPNGGVDNHTFHNGDLRNKGDWEKPMGRHREPISDSASVASLDSKGKQKSFRRLIVRFAEKTSMQGVPYINAAKLWWARLIWAVLLLVAVGIMVFHLVYLFNQYFAWPINTKVELGFSNLMFPDITICNTNPIVRAKLWEHDGALELKSLIEYMEPENLVSDQYNDNYDPWLEYGGGPGGGSTDQPPPGTTGPAGNGGGPQPPNKRKRRFVDELDELNLTQYQRDDWEDPDTGREFEEDEFDGVHDAAVEIQELFTELFMDLPKNVRSRIGHNISHMLLSCSYNERVCGSNLFKRHQTAEYGNCWTMSSDKFVTKAAGPSGGLSLILFLETNEYLKGITNGYGLRVSVHEKNTIPFPAELGVYVPAAMETDISLRMIEINRQSQPYGECDDGASFRKSFKNRFTRQACQVVCQLRKIVDECGCFDDHVEEIALLRNGSRPCRSAKEKKCMENWNLQFQRKEMTCPCVNPCTEIQYTKSVSSRQWPSDEYAIVLLEGVCEESPETCNTLRGGLDDKRRLSYNFVKLNIYYEDLNFQNITEEPEISVAQFLSDVGGAVGLWIGLSILSMMEVVQLLIEMCDFAVHRSLKQDSRSARRRERRRRNKELANQNGNGRDGERSDKHEDRYKDPESQLPNAGFAPRGERHGREDLSNNTDSWLHQHRHMRGDKYAKYPPSRDYHSDY